MTTGPYPHSNGVLRITYLGGRARERSMLTVLRHLLASVNFTLGHTVPKRGITPALNASTPGHTVPRATQLQYLTLGLGHTALGQGDYSRT